MKDTDCQNEPSIVVNCRERMGNFFFRHRSYLPLILFPIVLFQLWHDRYMDYNLHNDMILSLIGTNVSLLGLVIRSLTIGRVPGGTSSRNTAEGQVASVLNTDGLYSLIQHPLYLGNFLMWFGIAIYTSDLLMMLVFITVYWIIYDKIMLAEEMFLERKFGEEYKAWKARTPVILPYKWKLYRRSSSGFSLRTVLRKEYSGFFAVIVIFTFLFHVKHAIATQHIEINYPWAYTFLSGTIIYLTLRTIKRTTRWLHVAGR